MRMIMFLLGLFAMGSVLYGISAGVQTIQRGLARLLNHEASAAKPAPVTLEITGSGNAKDPAPSCQGNIGALRELYELHKQGALTKEEFQDWKHHLLNAVHSMSSIRRSGHFRNTP
ncbi:SHOCT domain-containing protein [Cupriavidus sp. LEh25]|nr:SHOCT domain-containing protein [Cupriavidus sp. LEh25]